VIEINKTIPFPDKKYQIIYADPPWKYGKWGKGSKKCVFNAKVQNIDSPLPYPSMTIEEIKTMNVKDISDANCELYLWTTQKYLPFSFGVIEAWGFKYCQTLTWCKKPMGTGQGGLYCPTTEFLILGRKGHMPKRTRINTTWWEIKREQKHSKKPDFYRDLITQMSEPPRIELFARQKTPGWDVWGNEVDMIKEEQMQTRIEFTEPAVKSEQVEMFKE